MYRIFLLTFSLLSALSIYSQDTLNRMDEKGRKQGFWRKQDSLGRKIYEGHFKDGFPAGEFRYYYTNGKLKTISVVSQHGKIAKTVSFFTNGRKMAEGSYLNEKKDSIWKFYREEDGLLISEENYHAGKKNGISKTFSDEGKVLEVVNWVAGLRNGPWEQFYTDGKLRLRAGYLNDEKCGPFKTFAFSGQPMVTGTYTAGHMDGKWTYYDDKGKVTKREFYSNGILLKIEE